MEGEKQFNERQNTSMWTEHIGRESVRLLLCPVQGFWPLGFEAIFPPPLVSGVGRVDPRDPLFGRTSFN